MSVFAWAALIPGALILIAVARRLFAPWEIVRSSGTVFGSYFTLRGALRWESRMNGGADLCCTYRVRRRGQP